MTGTPGRRRGGGTDTPTGFAFELTGGGLCLDLANTVDNRPTARRRELLTDFGRLLDWARQTRILARSRADRLRRQAAERPGRSETILLQARRLREAIFRIFASVAAGRRPPRRDLAALNSALPGALAGLRVSPQKGAGFRWVWDGGGVQMEILGPVIRSAAALLTAPARDRVRICAAPDCAWLFLDHSRNRSRRWCDMSVCGNRNKARRHYRRKKTRL
jgi:predicted RNA-binding Zn ribbon-like protein